MTSLLARHAELPVMALVFAAWIYMGWEGWQARRWTCCAPGAGGLEEAAGWLLMVVAMMLPAALPNIRDIAARSYRTMRAPLSFAYIGGYLSTWALAGSLLLAFEPLSPGWRLRCAASFCLAGVAWAFHPARRVFFVRCHVRIALRPQGYGAYADVLRQGSINATGCIGGCWPLMMACALAHHHFVMMIAGTVLVLSERRMFRFHSGPPAVGAACMALFTLTAL